MPGRIDVRVGTRVCLDLLLADELVCLQTGGVVQWRRSRNRADLPEGVGVQFDAEGPRFVAYLTNLCEGSAKESLEGAVHDISSTGVMIRSSTTVISGTVVEVQFTDHRGKALFAASEVRWSKPGYGMGLVFLEFLYGDEYQFWDFCRHVRGDSGPVMAARPL